MRKLIVLLTLSARIASAQSGVVEGTVKYAGTRSPPAAAQVPKSMAPCGHSQPQQVLLLDGERRLANVVVSIVVPNAPKPAPVDAKLDQSGCSYSPHVQAVPIGSHMQLRNSDALLHNVHARRGELTLINFAMPIPGQQLAAPPTLLNKPGVVSFKCDAGHAWMSAYVHVFDHPYFAITDASGHFKIAGVPPGSYTLKLEHELLGASTQPITVTASGATVDAVLK
jgi:hypothetical protein